MVRSLWCSPHIALLLRVRFDVRVGHDLLVRALWRCDAAIVSPPTFSLGHQPTRVWQTRRLGCKRLQLLLRLLLLLWLRQGLVDFDADCSCHDALCARQQLVPYGHHGWISYGSRDTQVVGHHSVLAVDF